MENNKYIFIISIIIGLFLGIYINLKNFNFFYKISKFNFEVLPKNPNILESSFFPFKSITLKGLIKIIFFSITIYIIKSFIYPILIEHLTEDLFQIHVICSVITFLLTNIFNESLDYIIKDVDLNSFKNLNIFNPNKDLTNNMEKGESSKMGESSKTRESSRAEESSKTGESSKAGRVITDSDYESDSSSSTKKNHPYTDQTYTEEGETNVSRLINANLPEFKETVKRLTNEEIVETMNVIEDAKEEYYISKVPSAKVQIENLNIKEDICASQLEENLSEKDTKGKGKEVDTNEKDYKGKGKEIDTNKKNSDDKE